MHRTLMLAAVALWAIVACPVGAQIVRGVVVEQDRGTPLEGAMVVLVDLDGRVVSRVLTDAGGGSSPTRIVPGRTVSVWIASVTRA